MLDRVITVSLIVVALIHILPVAGFLSVDRIAALYEIEIEEPNLEILMRHRAIMFGMLSAFLFYAAFNPSLQPIAFAMTFISVLAFLYLAVTVGPYNAAIKRVVIADVVALIVLVGGCAAWWLRQKQ
ncbi:MAG: phosphopantetheine adenylyltransferase [Burkholderiaceae bacterium]